MTLSPNMTTSPFRPCPTCGVLVCWQAWHHSTREAAPRWEPLPAPVSPITGAPHVCPKETA